MSGYKESFMDLSHFYNDSMELDINEEGIDDIKTLCEIVLNKHFSYVRRSGFSDEADDLMSEGYLKCIKLLRSGRFDVTKSLKNYLYTGVRNEMGNYLNRFKKETPVDDEILIKTNESRTMIDKETEINLVYIDISIIVDTINKLKNKNYLLNGVINKLNDYSFNIIGCDYVKDEKTEYTEEEKMDIDSIVSFILWSHFRNR